MSFDYVVVGAGAAGVVLADRLSANPHVQVALIERGPRQLNPRIAVPRALPFLLRTPGILDSYPVQVVSERDRTEYWVRGRGLGGSTLVNGMLYLHGERHLYDELETAGGHCWGWSAFASAYRAIERSATLSTVPGPDAGAELLLAAAESTGLRRVADVNAASGPRVGYSPATICRGRRRDVATAFLRRAARRSNLTIVTDAAATELIWAGDTVTGVRAAHEAGVIELSARREVVLACGALETPLLLERSGIGDRDVLREAGVEVRIHQPSVGERLIEQRGLGLQVRLRAPVGATMRLASTLTAAQHAARYAVRRTGALARPAFEVTALLASESSVREPDVAALMVPLALDVERGMMPAGHPGVFVSGYQIRPHTAGSVHLRAGGEPRIVARFDEHPGDRVVNERLLGRLRELVTASPLGELIDDGEGAQRGGQVAGSAIYHAVGSAAMGPREDDVVDQRLRVRGTTGLRIADLSVLPMHVSPATAAPAMAIGWIAADLIRDEG